MLRSPGQSKSFKTTKNPVFNWIFQSARRDSNPRPRPWQGRAPPTEPLAHIVDFISFLFPSTLNTILYLLKFVNTKMKHFFRNFFGFFSISICVIISSFKTTKNPVFNWIFQSARRDSNPRPRPWQGRAPPTEPLAHIVDFVSLSCSRRQSILYYMHPNLSTLFLKFFYFSILIGILLQNFPPAH